MLDEKLMPPLHLKIVPTFVWQSQSAYVDPTQDDVETQPEINCINVVFFSSIISSFEVLYSIFSARDTRDFLHDERKAR
jgi:hypothetical protein